MIYNIHACTDTLSHNMERECIVWATDPVHNIQARRECVRVCLCQREMGSTHKIHEYNHERERDREREKERVRQEEAREALCAV